MLVRIHYYSGLILASFISLHIFNHLVAIEGLQQHIDMMKRLRLVYRNSIAETLLLLAVSIQIYSGIRLYMGVKKRSAFDGFTKLQIYSGLYLSFFFVVHVAAVMIGRYVQHLDTNVYYGIAGLNTFPYYFFFLPYYTLAIIAFFTHIAAIHSKKMRSHVFGINPGKQSVIIIAIGIVFATIIIYTFTNGFKGFDIPESYQLKKQVAAKEK
jgi:hypothetical protein